MLSSEIKLGTKVVTSFKYVGERAFIGNVVDIKDNAFKSCPGTWVTIKVTETLTSDKDQIARVRTFGNKIMVPISHIIEIIGQEN